MDPNYAVFAHDLNHILDDKYECIDVSPIRHFAQEGGTQGAEKVESAQMADQIAYFVKIKDEYREPWWQEVGGTPQVCVALPVEKFESAAGLADQVKPLVEKDLAALYKAHNKKKKQSTQAGGR